jgi:hypothetical protein
MTMSPVGQRSRVGTFSPNPFKLGLFGLNLSSGRSATCVPERWSGTWDDNLKAAILADEAGMDFHLPVARWKGYGGATNFEGAGSSRPFTRRSSTRCSPRSSSSRPIRSGTAGSD